MIEFNIDKSFSKEDIQSNKLKVNLKLMSYLYSISITFLVFMSIVLFFYLESPFAYIQVNFNTSIITSIVLFLLVLLIAPFLIGRMLFNEDEDFEYFILLSFSIVFIIFFFGFTLSMLYFTISSVAGLVYSWVLQDRCDFLPFKDLVKIKNLKDKNEKVSMYIEYIDRPIVNIEYRKLKEYCDGIDSGLDK